MTEDYRPIEEEIARATDPEERSMLVGFLAELRAEGEENKLRKSRIDAKDRGLKRKILALRIAFIIPIALCVYWPVHMARTGDFFSLRSGTQISWEHAPGMFVVLGSLASIGAIWACVVVYLLLSSWLLLRRLEH